MTRCYDCKKEIRVNFPYGTKNKPVEIGHKEGCKGRVYA